MKKHNALKNRFDRIDKKLKRREVLMKGIICTAAGIVGAAISTAFRDMDTEIKTHIIIIAKDYITKKINP